MMRILFFIQILLVSLAACNQTEPVKVLVTAGGHDYDTLAFNAVFEQIEGIETTLVLQPAANRLIADGLVDDYDVLVFYDSWQEINEEEKQGYLELLEKGTGMVFMHHALVSYQQWPEFITIIGGKYVHPQFEPDTALHSDYRHDIQMRVMVNPGHPITEGINDFELFDEGYMNLVYLPGSTPLLETRHDFSDSIIGWAHKIKNSKVVYLMPGHGADAFVNPHYQNLISRSIHWVAVKEMND